jgi:hypothetical protein
MQLFMIAVTSAINQKKKSILSRKTMRIRIDFQTTNELIIILYQYNC